MSQLEFWNNNNYGGLSNTFVSTQRRSYNISQAWDSVKASSNTWAVVYDGENCTGNYLKIGGSGGGSNSDLNKTQRGSGHNDDWKNQIKSFMMFGSQPAWWNSSSAPSTNLSDLGADESAVCSSSNFYDDAKIFNGAQSYSDLSTVDYPTNTGQSLSNDIDSIATGSSVWMEVWNDTGYSGDFMTVNPNKSLTDLNTIERPSGLGGWGNQIKSLVTFTTKPACWDMSFDKNGFYELFPDYTSKNDSSGGYITYNTQDCNYDVRIINESYTQDTYTVSFRVDYSITAGTNDKAILNLTVNADGSLNNVSYSYTQSDGAVQIPNSVIKAVDKTVELLGAVGALETAGISEEAADDFLVAFDTFCKVFNAITKVLYKASEANDGRFYMLAVCLHTLCRAFANIES